MNGLGKSQKKVAIISTIASEALASEIDAQVACSLLRILLNEIGLTTEDADVRSLDSLFFFFVETTGKNAREIFTSEQRNQFTD